MAMKETVKSLRAYLILAGLLAGGSNVFQLAHIIKLSKAWNSMVPTWLLVLLYGMPVLNIVVAVAFIYAGISLRYYLDKGDPRRILKIILFSGVTAVLLGIIRFILNSTFMGGANATTPIGVVVIAILITWYLYANTKRLAKEAMISRKDELNEIFK